MIRNLFGAAKWIGEKVILPAAQKLIPQGSAEVMQALYTGQGYTPYGPTQEEVPMPKENDRLTDPPAPVVGTKSKGVDRD